MQDKENLLARVRRKVGFRDFNQEFKKIIWTDRSTLLKQNGSADRDSASLCSYQYYGCRNSGRNQSFNEIRTR